MDAHDITALRNDIAVARGQQTKPRTHGAFFADGLQVISVVQNTEKRCELMLLQAESSGLYDVVSKCMPAHSFRLFLRTKRVSIHAIYALMLLITMIRSMDRPVTHPNFREDCPPNFNTGQLDHTIILLMDHSHTQIVKLSSISKSALIHKKKRRGTLIYKRQRSTIIIVDILQRQHL